MLAALQNTMGRVALKQPISLCTSRNFNVAVKNQPKVCATGTARKTSSERCKAHSVCR